MDLDKYKELTGNSVAASREAKINAVIRRTKARLELMLGYSLKPKNLYTEKGIVQFEGYLPDLEDLEHLLPPDKEEGTYKLFPYKEADRFFHVDPYTNIYNVKLVLPLNDGEFATVTKLDNYAAKYDRDNIGKYIERHEEWFTWRWYDTDSGLMLAVEADWLDCYPSDLMYLWADMVDYYGNPNYNVMGSLKSESVDGHSWSRGNAGGGSSGDTAPEQSNTAIALLKRYAGPFGEIARNPVR